MKRLTVRSRSLLLIVALAVVAAMCTTPTARAASPGNSADAGEACVFNAPDGADLGLLGTYGHVGWGFELADGTWEYGANEGPQGGFGSPSNTWWMNEDTWDNMLSTFADGGPEYLYAKPGYYTTYRCTVVLAPNPSAADNEVNNEWSEPYWIPGQDCESQVYNVLSAYGVTWLPSDISDPAPNQWYQSLTGFTASTPLPGS